MGKFFTVYKTTNIINNKIYVGVHETYDLNDSYIGSGGYFLRAVKKYGLENFKKDILYVFDNKKEMLEKEKEIVNEDFIKRRDTYNVILGGGFHTGGLVNVKDSDGNCFLVSIDDERYLSGELVGITKGFVNVMDNDGNTFQVSSEEYLNNDNLSGITRNMVTVKNSDGDTFNVSIDDERYLSGELVGVTKGYVTVVDPNGDVNRVSVDCEEYLNGTYKKYKVPGKKHTSESIERIRNTNKGKGCGSDNSQYGTKWVYSMSLKMNKKIGVDELDNYLSDGWLIGRKMSF